MVAPTMGTALPVYATETDASAGQDSTPEGQDPTPKGPAAGEGATGGDAGNTGATGETGESGQVEEPQEPEKIETPVVPEEPEEPGKAEDPEKAEEAEEPEEAEDLEKVKDPEKAENPEKTDETGKTDPLNPDKTKEFTQAELDAVADRPNGNELDDVAVTPEGDTVELSDIEQVLRLNNDQDPSMYIATNTLYHRLSEADPADVDPYDDSNDIVSNRRYDHLTMAEQPVYNALKERILEVANGERSQTEFVLTTGDLSQEEFAAIYAIYSDCVETETYDSWYRLRDDLFNSLYYDLAQEFFWSKNSYACWFEDRTEDPDHEGEYIYEFHYRMAVGKDYRQYEEIPSENPDNVDYRYLCDTDKVKETRTILNDATAIAHEADGMTLYEALLYFKERIDALVVYDYAAAAQIGQDDHNMAPWNVLSGFDADPDSNIVCEGYAKAFKYLFDQWKEDNEDAAGKNTYCYIVVGDTDGGHMWNILHTEDTDDEGNPTYANYVIDLTNSDEEPDGTQHSQIFMQAPSTYKVFSENPDDTGYHVDSVYIGRTSSYSVDRMDYAWFSSRGESYEYLCMDCYSEKEIGVTDKDYPVPNESSGNRYGTNGVSTQNDEEEEVATATRYEHLTDLQQKVYSNIADQMRKVAEGNQSSTVFYVPVGDGTYELTEEEFDEIYQMDVDDELDEFTDAIYEALRADLMFDLYWYNNFHYEGRVDTQEYDSYIMQLTVAREYSPNERWDEYEFDTDQAAAAIEARNNADAIAAEADGMTLYEALCYLKERVCALASYDHPAGQDPGNYPNIAPWHMISTFDTDPDTNIVCESYARSFKYLFDAWKARNPVAAGEDTYCYYLGGYFTSVDVPNDAAGGHAWNVLHTTVDGENCNYFIDLTNCDEGLSEEGADYTPFNRQPFLRPPYFAQSISGIGGGKYDDRISQFYYNVGTSSSYNRLKYEYYYYNQDTGTYSSYAALRMYNSSEIDIGTDNHVPALKER